MKGTPHVTVRRLGAGVSLGMAVFGLACAREEPPPGSRPERTPPSVKELNPTLNEIVPGFGGSAEIRFSEPISGARNLEQNLVASPAARYQVSAGFSNLKIKPREGWLDGAVYYLQIPAGIADLLGNRTEDPILLVFSTGPEISRTQVAGDVSRRVSGEAVAEGRVLFYNVAGDSIPYTAVTDRDGEFRLPYLPPDDYWALAFEDFNRNLRLERPFEPYDSARFVLAPDGVASLSFRTVDPDSTPPLLVRASAQDSLSVRLEFDDYLDPDQDFAALSLRVRRVEGGSLEVAAILLEEMPRSGRGRSQETREERPRTDDQDRLEQLRAPPDTSIIDDTEPAEGAELDTASVAEAGAAAAIPPLPSQWLRIEFVAPLQDGAYEISIDSVLNLRRLAGSADTTFVYPEPQPESEEPADGEEAPADDETDEGAPAEEPAVEPPEDEPPS